MPNSMYGLDASFPQFTGKESTEQKVNAMYDYLVQLQQNMKYLLQNLGGENFNETELEKLGQVIREPIRLVVTNGKQSAEVQLKAGEAVLSAGQIRFEGVVTFTNDEEGWTRIDGDTVYAGDLRSDTVTIAEREGVGEQLIPGYLVFRQGRFVGNGAQLDVGSLGITDGNLILSGGDGVTVMVSSKGDLVLMGDRILLGGDVYVNGEQIGKPKTASAEEGDG